MKINLQSKDIRKIVAIGLFLLLTQISRPLLANGTNQPSNQNVIGQWTELDKLSDMKCLALIDDHQRDLQQIEKILLIKLESDSTVVRIFAAYLLGEYRFAQAADRLASMITLRDETPPKSERLWGVYPAQDALVKIGNVAIPALMRNLAESDDAKARELSMQVLCSIDGDKAIVRLRLQKVLAAQNNAQTQARIQLALKALEDASFGK